MLFGRSRRVGSLPDEIELRNFYGLLVGPLGYFRLLGKYVARNFSLWMLGAGIAVLRAIFVSPFWI